MSSARRASRIVHVAFLALSGLALHRVEAQPSPIDPSSPTPRESTRRAPAPAVPRRSTDIALTLDLGGSGEYGLADAPSPITFRAFFPSLVVTRHAAAWGFLRVGLEPLLLGNGATYPFMPAARLSFVAGVERDWAGVGLGAGGFAVRAVDRASRVGVSPAYAAYGTARGFVGRRDRFRLELAFGLGRGTGPVEDYPEPVHVAFHADASLQLALSPRGRYGPPYLRVEARWFGYRGWLYREVGVDFVVGPRRWLASRFPAIVVGFHWVDPWTLPEEGPMLAGRLGVEWIGARVGEGTKVRRLRRRHDPPRIDEPPPREEPGRLEDREPS